MGYSPAVRIDRMGFGDVIRIKDGVICEHGDVFQNEATRTESKSELPMFGDAFPKSGTEAPA